MREILFRAKRKDDGELAEGYFVIEGISCYIYSHPKVAKGTDLGGYLDCNDRYEIDPNTLGQFTGLVDKNGVKIFEGDIVRTKYGRLCTVVWFSSQEHNGWDLEPIRTVHNCIHTKPPEPCDLYNKNNLEVIGNIHDNPEIFLLC